MTFIRRCRAVFLMLVLFLTVADMAGPLRADGRAPAPRFFSVLEDVPLMAGLREMEELAAVFDKPQGRIAESVADLGELHPAVVEGYYRATLPQLGWRRLGENTFIRQGEELRFSIGREEGMYFIHIMVNPAE